MINIEYKVQINIDGVKYNVGLEVHIDDEVSTDPVVIVKSLELQTRAIKETVLKILLGDDCEHHPSQKIIGITSLHPICNQCIKEGRT